MINKSLINGTEEKKPILSICIPTYNRKNKIMRQLRYLKDEIRNDVEVIISDNCSPDNTFEYLEEYQKTEPWLRINRNQINVGADKNMYILAHMASGKYIWFLGDDDFIERGYVEKITKMLKTISCVFYHFSYYSFDEISQQINMTKTYLNVKYNEPVTLSDKEITEILIKDLSGFMFMSGNIYLRQTVLQCEKVTHLDYGTTLLWSIASMKAGSSYLIDSVHILSGVNTSWSKQQEKVWFCEIPRIIKTSAEFGLSPKMINRILNNNLTIFLIFSLIVKPIERGRQYNYIFKNLNIQIVILFVPFVLKQAYLKIKRKLKLLNRKNSEVIKLENYLIQ